MIKIFNHSYKKICYLDEYKYFRPTANKLYKEKLKNEQKFLTIDKLLTFITDRN